MDRCGNGTSNLAVEICFDNTTWGANFGVQTTQYANNNKGRRTYGFFDDGASGCSMDGGFIATQANRRHRPNMQFTFGALSCDTPGLPINLTTTSSTQSTAIIDFDPGVGGSPTITYDVEVYTSEGVLEAAGNIPSPPVEVTGLLCSSDFYFRVRARTSCDNSTSAWTANSAIFSTQVCECLDAVYGQWPGGTFTPVCNGEASLITGDAWAGEYSLVNVEEGFEYTFSGSIASDQITISNQLGTILLTTGQSSVTWISDFTGVVRFYTHSDEFCSANTNMRSRSVTCGSSCETLPGTLSTSTPDIVVNGAGIFEVSGGDGTMTAFEFSFDNFATVEWSYETTDNPFHLIMNALEETVSVRAIVQAPGCSPAYTNPVDVTLECATPILNGSFDGDFITNVTFGDINNTSTTGIYPGQGYEDFTYLSTEVCKGNDYTLTVSGTETFGANQGFAAWIDFNGDGIFQEDENVLLAAPTTTASTTVTIPALAGNGEVKLRVACQWNGTPDVNACDPTPYGYGEIEEYTIIISEPPTAPTSIAGVAEVCPGTETTLTAQGGSEGSGASYEWFAGSCGSAVIGTAASITVSPNAATTYYVRRVSNSSCGSETDCAELTVEVSPCVYYSVESGAMSDAVWNTDPMASEGELAVFGPQSNFVIRNGQTIEVEANAVMLNLTIEDTNGEGELDFNGEHWVTLYGNLLQTGGSISAGEGGFIFNAGTVQNIQVSDALNNVTVNNASGVSIGSDLDLTGVLKIDQGDFTAMPHTVTLISNALGTASIGAIAFGSSFIGEVNHQRYIPTGIQNWVNLCNPIPGLSLNDWNTTLVTTGFPGSGWPNYNFVNILQYDENVPGGLNDGFTEPVSINDPLDDARGYFVFMTAAAQFTSVTGAIQQGSRTIPLNYTSTGVPENDGWELMANIYPSEVDWEELYNASNGIAATYYVYDSESAAYSHYTAGLGLGTASGYIPSGQSFWVQTFESGAALQWDETHKSNEGSAFERDVNPNISYVSVGIATGNSAQSSYLVFEDGAQHAYDPGVDAVHFGSMSNTAPEIAWKASTGQQLAVSRIPKAYQNVEVYLHMKIKQAGTYTVTVDETQNLPEFTCMYFEDLENGDIYSLEAGEVITLTFDEPFDDDRFVLHVDAPVQSNVTAPSCFNTQDAFIEVEVDDSIAYSFTLSDEEGLEVGNASNVTSAGFSGLTAGNYTVTAHSDEAVCTAMIIQVEVVAPDEPFIDVMSSTPFCNALESGEIEILASGAGNFSIDLFNQSNAHILSDNMEAGGFDISNLNPGVYQVIVNNQCTSETFDIVLEDENAVIANAVFNEQITFENNAALLQADAQCLNAEGWTWFVNGEEVANGGNLQYAITTQGSYIIELVAFNETCTDSFVFEVTTSAVTYVQSQNEDSFRLGMTNEFVILWMPERAEALVVEHL